MPLTKVDKAEINAMMDEKNKGLLEALTNMLNCKQGQTPVILENCTGDAQFALSEKGEQTMAKGQRMRVCIGYNDDGSAIEKMISGNSQHELADRAVLAILNSERRGELLAKCGIIQDNQPCEKPARLFSEYAAEWLRNNLNINANTKATYRKVLNADINPFFGNRELSSITVNDMQIYFSGLQEAEYSMNTGNTCKTIIKQVLQCAVTDGYIVINPAADPRIKNPCKKKSEREALTEEQWIDVVGQIHTKLSGDERLYMYIVAFTALRRGEVLALRYEDFDFGNNKLTVSRNVTFPDGYNPNVGIPKGKKTATVPIAKELARELKECFQQRDRKGYLFHRANDCEKPYTNGLFWKMWEHIRETFDLHGATSHVFRHTVCTLLNAKGVDLKTISVIARHASEVTTYRYIHTNEAKKQEAIEALDAIVA